MTPRTVSRVPSTLCAVVALLLSVLLAHQFRSYLPRVPAPWLVAALGIGAALGPPAATYWGRRNKDLLVQASLGKRSGLVLLLAPFIFAVLTAIGTRPYSLFGTWWSVHRAPTALLLILLAAVAWGVAAEWTLVRELASAERTARDLIEDGAATFGPDSSEAREALQREQQSLADGVYMMALWLAAAGVIIGLALLAMRSLGAE